VQLGPQYRDLLRQRTLLEDSAAALAKRAEESRLASSLSRTQANVRVLQAAAPPLTGSTGRPVMLLAGIVVGLVAAGGVTVLSVALLQSMLTPHDVEQKLATPVALTITFDPTAVAGRNERGGLPRPMYLTPDDAKVLSHLLSSLAPRPQCSLQMIGASDGVGVSSLLVDFALLAARERQKVLILDLEPQRGRSCAELLMLRGARIHPITGDGSVARVSNSNLYLTPPANHNNELALGERDWTKLLGQARKDYDLILIDAPPLSRSWLGLFAAPSVDATLAVIEAEETRAPVALNMVDRIGGVGGVVAAAILNKRRFYIPKAVYNWI
jgi:Mrp family chromosome partitioning ATPase